MVYASGLDHGGLPVMHGGAGSLFGGHCWQYRNNYIQNTLISLFMPDCFGCVFQLFCSFVYRICPGGVMMMIASRFTLDPTPLDETPTHSGSGSAWWNGSARTKPASTEPQNISRSREGIIATENVASRV